MTAKYVEYSSSLQEEMFKEFAVNFFAAVTPATISTLCHIVDTVCQYPGGRKKLTLVVSSSGGDIQRALTACNYLKTLPLDIVTHATSVAASAGLLLYCLGQERRAHKYTHFTLHPMTLSATSGGYDLSFLREAIGLLESQEKAMAGIVASATGKTEDTILQDIRQRKVMDVAQAKDYGLVTEINDDIYYGTPFTFSVGETDCIVPPPYVPPQHRMSFLGDVSSQLINREILCGQGYVIQ